LPPNQVFVSCTS